MVPSPAVFTRCPMCWSISAPTFFTNSSIRASPMSSKFWLGAGGAVLLMLALTALFAPQLAPHDPLRQNLDKDLLAYSGEHPLGTDKLGRDIMSRAIYGARISLLVGVNLRPFGALGRCAQSPVARP